jgi:predicted CopG family antitoxin
MRHITVSVPDDVYLRMQARAAELAKSLSDLIREHLLQLDAGSKADFELGKRLQEETLQAIGIFHGSNRLSRDEVHDRDALR